MISQLIYEVPLPTLVMLWFQEEIWRNWISWRH